jgi:hypothetical protein
MYFYLFIYANMIFLFLRDLTLCKQTKTYFHIFESLIFFFLKFQRKISIFNTRYVSYNVTL